jgi:nitric oxide reductase subunit B
VFTHPRPGSRAPANRAAFYFLFGSALFELVGAGILGFTQTFSLTNVWEHGTWVTPAHAHLAFFGTFGMLVLAAAYAVIPAIFGKREFNDRLSRAAFWILFVGLLGMALSFAMGGTVQVYVYRILGIEFFGPVVRPAMQIWKALLFVFGVVFATGVIALTYDLLTLKDRGAMPASAQTSPARETVWNRPLTVFEMAVWLAVLWLIGLILTGALLVNNLTSVRVGDPTFPYLLAGVGYPALVLVTFALAVRFLHARNVSYE